jgi:aspartate--ammonia ligase
MPHLVLKDGYKPLLGLRETEQAIKFIKDLFEDRLARALNLQRVSAPLFLRKGSGIWPKDMVDQCRKAGVSLL